MNARTLTAAVLCCLAWAATDARAAEFGVHIASIHAPAKDGQNNSNTGIYFRAESGLAAGVYRNTQSRLSPYLAQSFAVGPVDIDVGFVGGYQRKCTDHLVKTEKRVSVERSGGESVARPMFERRQDCSGFSRGYFTPMVAPSIAAPFSVMGARPRLWFIPSLGRTSSVVHISLEATF